MVNGIYSLGAKIATELGENTRVFKAMNSTLSSVPFPGCEQYKMRSDAYWECLHRHFTLTIVSL